MIITDGCPGLAAAIKTLYPRVRHQRCWVHKMRNLVNGVRRADREAIAASARAIYRAEHGKAAEEAFRQFQKRWGEPYPKLVRQLERDLPELLNFFAFPRHLWKKLRTANVIERVFVEVRRRTRPHGLLCQHPKRRPDHLLDLPSL